MATTTKAASTPDTSSKAPAKAPAPAPQPSSGGEASKRAAAPPPEKASADTGSEPPAPRAKTVAPREDSVDADFEEGARGDLAKGLRDSWGEQDGPSQARSEDSRANSSPADGPQNDGPRNDEPQNDAPQNNGDFTGTDEAGNEVTQRSYTKNGVDYTEKTVTSPDGTVRTVLEADRDGVIERTVSETEEVEGDIEDYAGDAITVNNTEDRAAVERTETYVTVIDTTQDPPKETTVERSTSYRQHIPMSDSPPYVTDDQVTLPQNATGTVTQVDLHDGPLSSVDEEKSGNFLSFTETTTYDGDEATTTTQASNEHRVIGVGASGQPVSVISGTSDIQGEDAEDPDDFSRTEVTEIKGLLPPDHAYDSLEGAPDSEEFEERAARIGGDFVNYRRVTESNWSGEGTTTQEIGNYDSPNEDGHTISVTSDSQQSQTGAFASGQSLSNHSLTYRQVTGDGSHIQEQTVIPGTEYSSLTDTMREDNGEFTSSTTERLGDQVLSETTHVRTLAEPGEGRPPGVTAEDWKQFQDSTRGERTFVDAFTQDRYNEDGEFVGSTDYSARVGEHGATVGALTHNQEGVETTLSVFQDPESGEGRVRLPNGTVAEIDPRGSLVVNGKTVDSAGLPSTGESPLGFLSDTLSAADAADDTLIPDGLTKSLDTLGVGVGLVNLGSSLANGDLEGAGESVASTAASTYGLAEAFAASRAGTTLGIASRTLGSIGSVASAALGVKDIVEGDYLQGSLHLAQGAGLAIAFSFPQVGVPIYTVASILSFATGDDPEGHEALAF